MQHNHSSLRTWRVGLAGCGCIAPLHIGGLAALPDISLVGLADPDAQAMANLIQASPGEIRRLSTSQLACCADLAQLLAEAAPEVVHICTPHYTHVPLAGLALARGCHVLLEKPPAISLADLADLAAAVRQSTARLGICFQNRFNRSSLQARQLLDAGVAGPVRAARAFVTWRRDEAYYRQADWRGRWTTEGGGVMINQAIHTLDLLIWLAGQPLSVSGQIANRHLRAIIEVEDTAEMTLRLAGGATAVFYATTAYGGDAPVFLELDCGALRIRIEGDCLTLQDGEGNPLPSARQRRLLDEAAEAAPVPPAYAAGWADAKSARRAGKSCWGQGHQRLIRAFYHSLEPDAPAFPIDLDSGSLALKALLALYEAAASDREIILAE
jgi:predicted dehydrogenase